MSEPYAGTPTLLTPVPPLGPGRIAFRIDLTEQQLRINEVFLRCEGKRHERINSIIRIMDHRYKVALTPQQVEDALAGIHAKRYRHRLKNRGRMLALRKLRQHIPDVVEDYVWAREKAKDEGDYRELHKQAVDHLDRVGVTLKKEAPAVQVQAIVLRGRNFDLDTLEKDSPRVEALPTEGDRVDE